MRHTKAQAPICAVHVAAVSNGILDAVNTGQNSSNTNKMIAAGLWVYNMYDTLKNNTIKSLI